MLMLTLLPCLHHLLDRAVALEAGQAVDEEGAVEVVDLVLSGGGEQAAHLVLMTGTVEVGPAQPHRVGALDLRVLTPST